MGLPAMKQEFTYADYQSWDDGERWEIIDGEAYDMSPAPERIHQDISMEILMQLGNQLKDKKCRVYHPPFDVRLPLANQKDDQEIINVVQPDISVICDPRKLDKKGCNGAPDLIIEILSPPTSRKDRMEKYNLYEQAGVKEYWLVSPDEQMVEVHILGPEGQYGRPFKYNEKNSVQLQVLKDITIELAPVFQVE